MGEYWIWYLILQTQLLFLLCSHSSVITFLFFPNRMHNIYREIGCQQFSFQSSLHNTHSTYADILMKGWISRVSQMNSTCEGGQFGQNGQKRREN